jgi:hypothetical protein
VCNDLSMDRHWSREYCEGSILYAGEFSWRDNNDSLGNCSIANPDMIRLYAKGASFKTVTGIRVGGPVVATEDEPPMVAVESEFE